jgi:hypothetical protein
MEVHRAEYDALSSRGITGRYDRASKRNGTPDASGGREIAMTDLLIFVLTLALFATTVGFVRLCERM